MQLTINISDKAIKQALDNRLNYVLYEDFDPVVLKKAKVPKKTALLNQLMADTKFIAALEKATIAALDQSVNTAAEDAVFDTDLPADVAKACAACEKIASDIVDAQVKQAWLNTLECQIDDVIAYLNDNGYKVSKG